MLKKGDQTKQMILSRSKKLFSEKGYATITMKDVCEVCNLSRGGLYRYFSSTKDIFTEILDEDKEEKRGLLEEEMRSNTAADLLFKAFLEDRKNTKMLGEDQGLSFAIHEFSRLETQQQLFFINRYHDAVSGLTLLFQYGQQQGRFQDFNPQTMAIHVLLLLDSLEISTAMLKISEKEINDQFELLYRQIIKFYE